MIDEWRKGAQYWDHAWNPVVGCVPVSEGCENCYASAICNRFKMNGDSGFSPTLKKYSSPPRKGIVFVGNMTDIFGEWNTDEQIRKWFDMLHHEGDYYAEYLILTKRVKRFSEFHGGDAHYGAPINMGMTAENQQRYDERIKDFCYTKQFFPWVSLEPLLSHIDLGLSYIAPEDYPFWWVVVGAESGSNRRPCKIEWVESIVRQCCITGIPVFVKQLDLGGKLVTDINKFPGHLQIRQVPWFQNLGSQGCANF